MGIKGLWSLLKPEERKLKDLAGKRIAIDTSLYVYKWFSIGQSYSIEKNWVRGLLAQMAEFVKHDILPIYVVDGPSSHAKKETLEKRKKMESLKIPREVWDECREIIMCAGMPIVQARAESDHCMAALYAAGHIDLVMTEDSDLVAMGAAVLRKSGKTYTLYNAKDAVASLGMTQAQFLQFCILLGTDYMSGSDKPVSPTVAKKAILSGEMTLVQKAMIDKIEPEMALNALDGQLSTTLVRKSADHVRFAKYLKAISSRAGLVNVKTLGLCPI